MTEKTEQELQIMKAQKQDFITESNRLKRKAEEEIAEIDKAINLIKNSPKKPVYGDFGIATNVFEDKYEVLVSHRHHSHPYKPEERIWTHNREGEAAGCPLQVLPNPHGNIFDLMEEAGPGGVIIAFTKKKAEMHLKRATYCGHVEIDEKIKSAIKRLRTDSEGE